MSSASVVLLVFTSLFIGVAFASLTDALVSKRGGVSKEKRTSIRITLFFLFMSCVIITLSCLVIFTPFLDEYRNYQTKDYVYVIMWFFIGFLSALWYKTCLPLFASLYVLLFLSFSYYLDTTCLSYAGPVMITFNKETVIQDNFPVPVVQSVDDVIDPSLQKTGYLVVQEYKIPPKMLFPVKKSYYRLILFSQNRIIQNDFAQDFFLPVQDAKPSFFYIIGSLLESLYALVSENNTDNNAVFYFVEIQLAGFYPYVFTLQPVKSAEGFSYILDKLI